MQPLVASPSLLNALETEKHLPPTPLGTSGWLHCLLYTFRGINKFSLIYVPATTLNGSLIMCGISLRPKKAEEPEQTLWPRRVHRASCSLQPRKVVGY